MRRVRCDVCPSGRSYRHSGDWRMLNCNGPAFRCQLGEIVRTLADALITKLKVRFLPRSPQITGNVIWLPGSTRDAFFVQSRYEPIIAEPFSSDSLMRFSTSVPRLRLRPQRTRQRLLKHTVRKIMGTLIEEGVGNIVDGRSCHPSPVRPRVRSRTSGNREPCR